MRCDGCGHEQADGRFCGYCGARLNSETRAGDEGSSEEHREDSSSWTLRRVVAGVVVMGLAASLLGLLMRGRQDAGGLVALPSPATDATSPGAATDQPSAIRSPRATETVDIAFSAPTGTALLFDDGHDGVVALDVDSGRRAAFRLPGQRPGDQPFRLLRMGGWLVYGWGTIWAAAPGSDLPVRQLGNATIFVPAAQPDQLWLIDYPGGRLGQGTPTWTLVDNAGQELHQAEGEDGMYAVRGVPGGLAVRDENATLRRYDVTAGELEDYLGDRDAQIGDVTVDRVVWCERDCERLRIADGEGREVGLIDGPQVDSFDPNAMWLSSGGDQLAVHTRVRESSGTNLELRIYDLNADQLSAKATVPLGDVNGAWTLDGRQFFYRTMPGASAPARLKVLGRYSVDTGTFEHVPLDTETAPAHRFVTLPVESLRRLFR